MTIDLVILDCDGVLIDSEPIISRAHAGMLTACGYSMTPEVLVERFCGVSDREMFAVIEGERGGPLPRCYAERVAAIIEHEFRHRLVAIPGIVEALDAVPQPMCVASSSTPEQLDRKLRLTGLRARFGDAVFSASMVARGKPAPDLFLYAARRMGAAAHRCLVVEDSPAGIDAACAAGMTAIGFCGGGHCQPGHDGRLASRGARFTLADMRELPAAVAQISAAS